MKIFELLDTKEKFTRLAYARDSNNRFVHPRNVKAVCWCLLGAGQFCYPEPEDRQRAFRKIEILLENRGVIKKNADYCQLSEFSDMASYEDVVDIARKADV